MAAISYANRTRWIGPEAEQADNTNVPAGATWWDSVTGGRFTFDGTDWLPGPDISHGPLALHRAGLQAVETEPAQWVSNGGLYTKAQVDVIGATWADVDTDVILTFGIYRRFAGSLPVKGGAFSVTAVAKKTPILTDSGTVTYESDSITDDDQAESFPAVMPADGDPSQYIVTAEPADTGDPAFFGWATSGGTPPTLIVQRSFIGVYDEDGMHLNRGWVGGATPDVTAVTYSIRKPNISYGQTVEGLDGADLAIVLETIAGTPGKITADVTVVLS